MEQPAVEDYVLVSERELNRLHAVEEGAIALMGSIQRLKELEKRIFPLP